MSRIQSQMLQANWLNDLNVHSEDIVISWLQPFNYQNPKNMPQVFRLNSPNKSGAFNKCLFITRKCANLF